MNITFSKATNWRTITQSLFYGLVFKHNYLIHFKNCINLFRSCYVFQLFVKSCVINKYVSVIRTFDVSTLLMRQYKHEAAAAHKRATTCYPNENVPIAVFFIFSVDGVSVCKLGVRSRYVLYRFALDKLDVFQ